MSAEPNFKLATVGDVQLEYIDIGKGGHTIVIESGISTGIDYWRALLPELTLLEQRVIIYSRAGNGHSSTAGDASIKTSNTRLHALLELLEANTQLVLVGHSFGALHSRAYANAYKEQVIGMVLLDPSHEGFRKKLVELDRSWAEKDDEKLNSMLADNQEWSVLQSHYHSATLSDKGSIRAIPTVIVTSSKLDKSDWWIGYSAQGKLIWRELHASLISENPNSSHIVSSLTGHNIPIDAPSLVSSAINQVIELSQNYSN
ncbi:MAG: pimeloyl-ACP methyl ester carboxylesterase [Flavobacteriales bacterium]|jgi:pimeloyl-ACP methyl ester carboxylesterase